jgi:hypothetical protein
MREER